MHINTRDDDRICAFFINKYYTPHTKETILSNNRITVCVNMQKTCRSVNMLRHTQLQSQKKYVFHEPI